MVNKVVNYHDKWENALFEEYKKSNKKLAVQGFLSSLKKKNSNSLRSGLPVIAIMQTFPRHKFTFEKPKPSNWDKLSEEDRVFMIERRPCEVCSTSYSLYTFPDEELLEKTEEYFEEGGLVVAAGMQTYYCYLKIFNDLKDIPQPTKEDIGIFIEILDVLLKTENNTTLKKEVLQQISKINNFKANKYQIQLILETLGYCSILETEEHKGLLNEFINVANAPRKTRSSDWAYPVDFWTGKDGINKKAFKFWFGEYKELERFWK